MPAHFVFNDDKVIPSLVCLLASPSSQMDVMKHLFLIGNERGLFLHVTNGEDGGALVKFPQGRVITEGKMLLPVKDKSWMGFQKKIVQLKMDDKGNLIHAVVGEDNFDITTMLTDDYPDFPYSPFTTPGCVLTVDEFKKLLIASKFATSDSKSTEENKSTYLKFEKGKASSVGQNMGMIFAQVLIKIKSTNEFDPFQCVLTQSATRLLKTSILDLAGDQELWLFKPQGKSRLVIQTPDGNMMFWLNECVSDGMKFINMTNATNQLSKNFKSGTVNTGQMKSIIKNILTLVQDKSVTPFQFGPTSQIQFNGEFYKNGVSEIPIAVEGDPLQIVLDSKFVNEALDELDSGVPSVLKLGGAKLPVIFEQVRGNFAIRIPIMPISLN